MNKLLDSVPKPLLNDIITGHCLPVIGAGFSANANVPDQKKMPLWDELGRSFAASLPDYPYTTPIDAISAYCQEYSRPAMIEELGKLLHIDNSSPGRAHFAFSKVPFDIVCTTNIDFLLEKAYSSKPSSQYCRPIIDEDQLSVTGTSPVTLVKLHGDLHHPNHLVVTEEDYDTFISKYPLLCTYLANLLITRTPLFIGYSLEDPDFRQIWQVIGNRLHRMRRSAYVLAVGCKPPDVARYQRRGVKVLNLPGSRTTYGETLASFFDELSDYWPLKLRQSGTITDESVGELTLPKESASRLCFFAVPNSLISFYKYFVFPMAEKFGFVPMTAESMVVPSDNIVAKITALIEKAQLVVADASSAGVIVEVEMALRMKTRPQVLLIVPENDRARYLFDISGATIVRRPEDLLSSARNDADPVFLHSIEQWFGRQAESLQMSFLEEPERLLQKREYPSAVISVMTLWEVTLTELLSKNLSGDRKVPMQMSTMLRYATELQIITQDESQKFFTYWMLRTKLVHGKETTNAHEAKKVVTFVLQIIKRLKKPGK